MKTQRKLNLQSLKKSRLNTGDIFAMLLSDGKYLFGRVINAELHMMGGKVALLYIYKLRSDRPEVDTSLLTPMQLLMPPIITFRNFWTDGYAVKITTALLNTENYTIHRFKASNNKYFNEFGQEIADPQQGELLGSWGVTSIGSIDDQISDALSIKRAPLHEEDMWYISGRGEKILLKRKDSELQKYSNYGWIIKNHPEIVER